MKIKIYAQETFTTTVTRSSIVINTEDYPELEGMNEDEISDYIDNNVWDMKPTDDGVYSSLGEELSDSDIEYDDITDDSTEFYVEEV